MPDITISDWVLILTSLFLGATALLVPVISEYMKRYLFAPRLVIEVKHEPPHSLKTQWQYANDLTRNEPVYYFRIGVLNSGLSQARLVESVLEELWIYDQADIPHLYPNFSAINQHWAGASDTFMNINPKRRLYCDIGHISSANYQLTNESRIRIDVPGRHAQGELRFVFDLAQYPLSQPNSLVPGRYAIKIALYSENAPRKEIYLKLTWSGRWQDTEPEMFREMVIENIRPIRPRT